MTDAHLTTPNPGDLNALMSANPPGMAWIAGTGPRGETCRTCQHWRRGARPTYDIPTKLSPSPTGRTFDLKPRSCAEFTRLMRASLREVIGDKVPADTKACRSFDAFDGDLAPLRHVDFVKQREAEKAARKAVKKARAP